MTVRFKLQIAMLNTNHLVYISYMCDKKMFYIVMNNHNKEIYKLCFYICGMWKIMM